MKFGVAVLHRLGDALVRKRAARLCHGFTRPPIGDSAPMVR